jgi:hypothetical protein
MRPAPAVLSRRTRGLLGLALAACALVLALPAAAAAQDTPREHFQIKIGPSYDEGDFGTSDTTKTFFLPVTLRYLGENFDVSATFSWVHIDTVGGVTLIDGTPVPTDEGAGERRTDSGFGDISLRARYFLIDDPGPQSLLPSVWPFVKVKIPTADEDKDLGTGEWDFGLGVELDKTFFGWVTVLGDVSYTFIGDPPGENFRNRPTASIGVALKVAEPITVTALLDWRRAIVSGTDDALELLGMVTFRVSPTFSVTPNAFVGLTEGSPDWGVGVELSYKFGRF